MLLPAAIDAGVSRLLLERLRECGSVRIPSHGLSMYPFVRDGDDCAFTAVTVSELQPGDVVLYRTADEHLVGHRLIIAIQNGEDTLYVCKGDTNRYPDAPIRGESVLGKLVTIHRGEKTMRLNTPIYRLWTRLILHVPLYSLVCRYILMQRHIWRHRLLRLESIRKSPNKEHS